MSIIDTLRQLAKVLLAVEATTDSEPALKEADKLVQEAIAPLLFLDSLLPTESIAVFADRAIYSRRTSTTVQTVLKPGVPSQTLQDFAREFQDAERPLSPGEAERIDYQTLERERHHYKKLCEEQAAELQRQDSRLADSKSFRAGIEAALHKAGIPTSNTYVSAIETLAWQRDTERARADKMALQKERADVYLKDIMGVCQDYQDYFR